jgi:hypothetical protein
MDKNLISCWYNCSLCNYGSNIEWDLSFVFGCIYCLYCTVWHSKLTLSISQFLFGQFGRNLHRIIYCSCFISAAKIRFLRIIIYVFKGKSLFLFSKGFMMVFHYPVKNFDKKNGRKRVHKNMETCLSVKKTVLRFSERVHKQRRKFYAQKNAFFAVPSYCRMLS